MLLPAVCLMKDRHVTFMAFLLKIFINLFSKKMYINRKGHYYFQHVWHAFHILKISKLVDLIQKCCLIGQPLTKKKTKRVQQSFKLFFLTPCLIKNCSVGEKALDDQAGDEY